MFEREHFAPPRARATDLPENAVLNIFSARREFCRNQ
jgi:hypothetical protein